MRRAHARNFTTCSLAASRDFGVWQQYLLQYKRLFRDCGLTLTKYCILFSQDVYEWPESQCQFPSWLTAKSSWRSLDATVRYAVSAAGDVVTRRSNVSMATGARDPITTFRCLRSTMATRGANSSGVTDHVAYVTVHWLDGW